MNERYKIRSVGGAAVVTVPQSVMRQMRLQVGDKVIFDVRKVAGEEAILVLPDKPLVKKAK
jgi:antitoxin component of MazEF toxin-antitoxin module